MPTFNSIIRNFNAVPEIEISEAGMEPTKKTGFGRALEYARETLSAVYATAKQVKISTELYESCEKQNEILVNKSKTFIVNWKELAERDNVLLAITPNLRKEGSFQLTSRDTEILKIPVNENQIFLHANQYTASYKDFDSCLKHANEIIDSRK